MKCDPVRHSELWLPTAADSRAGRQRWRGRLAVRARAAARDLALSLVSQIGALEQRCSYPKTMLRSPSRYFNIRVPGRPLAILRWVLLVGRQVISF